MAETRQKRRGNLGVTRTTRVTTPLLLIAVLGLALYAVFFDSLPPWSEQKHARAYTDLSIPLTAKVDTVAQQGGFMQGASYFAQLSLDSAAFARIVGEAQSKGYKPLSSATPTEASFLNRYTARGVKGWYRIVYPREGGAEFVLLNANTRTVVIQGVSS